MQPSLQLKVLESLESAHNYNRWLAELTLPFLGDDPIEVGSGVGSAAALWLELGVPRLTTTEIDAPSLERLRARFADDARVSVHRLDVEEPSSEGMHTAVVGLNVFEHIRDDAAALRNAVRLVRPGGRVVIFVPAFSFAAGRFDRLIGHYRRYTVASASRALEAAGMRVEHAAYVNAPGLLAWFALVRVLGRIPSDGILLRAWDRLAVPLIKRVERRHRPPFGQSVLAVGVRT